jgi:hypothetical protein
MEHLLLPLSNLNLLLEQSGHVGKSGTPSAGIMFGGNTPPGAKVTAACRGMEWCKFSSNKNNNGKLIWQII